MVRGGLTGFGDTLVSKTLGSHVRGGGGGGSLVKMNAMSINYLEGAFPLFTHRVDAYVGDE